MIEILYVSCIMAWANKKGTGRGGGGGGGDSYTIQERR